MEWEWFKAGVIKVATWGGAILATWGANYARKRWKPFYKNLVAFIGLANRVISLEKTQAKQKQELEVIDNLLLAKLKIDEKPMFLNDNKGNLVFVNNSWLKVLGYSDPEDAYGEGYLLAIPEADRERVHRQAQRYAASPSPFSGVVTFINISTEAEVKTFCRTELVFDNNGNFFKTIGRLDILSITPKINLP